MKGSDKLNKHSPIKPQASLLERASKLYDFGAMLRGGDGAAPVPPVPPVPTAPVAQPVSQPAAVQPVSQPAPIAPLAQPAPAAVVQPLAELFRPRPRGFAHPY